MPNQSKRFQPQHKNQSQKRLSLPTLNPTIRPSLNSNPLQTLGKYHSQHKIITNNQTHANLKLLPAKYTQTSTQSKEKNKESTQSKEKLKQSILSKEKYKTRLDRLPDILSQGQFVRKNEQSMNSSLEQSHQIQHQLLLPTSSPEPQLWLIKKHPLNFNTTTTNTNAKSSLHQIITYSSSTTLLTHSSTTLITSSSTSPTKPHPLSTISQSSLQPASFHKLKLVGPEAVEKFYSHYKKFDRIKQLEEIQQHYNPITVILTILQTYNIPPKRMDIIKLKGNESILDLNQIGLGHSISVNAISDILQKIKYFKTINLSHNSITFDRVDLIIPQLRGINKIDLSHNRISRQGADLLATTVCVRQNNDNDDKSSVSSSSDSESDFLQELNLEQNGLSDQSLNKFLSSAKSFRQLKILNLSKNFLGNNFALRLKQFLIDQRHLNELYLHWNDISSKGMKYIFQGLAVNRRLKVLDLSWNQIGYEAIAGMCNFLRRNTTLLHLDISHCNICFDDSRQIALSLQVNHTLFGIHYEGNKGKIDGMGFLIPFENNKEEPQLSLRNQITHRIYSLQRNYLPNNRYDLPHERQLRTCWICNGWREKTIVIKKNPEVDQACFIHFDFEEFRGVAMGQVQGNYQVTKMFPAFDQVLFFITKVNKSKQFMHQAAVQYKGVNEFQSHKLASVLKVRQFYIEQKAFSNVELDEINGLGEMGVESEEMFDERYAYQWSCRPRTYGYVADRGLFVVEKKQKARRKKQRNRDNDKQARELRPMQLLFSDNSQDPFSNKPFLSQCVEFDVSNSKVRKLLPNAQDISAIWSILQQHYTTFANIYHHLSSNAVSSVSSLYYISETRLDQLLDFMQLEDKHFSRAQIRLKLVATLSVNDDFSKVESKNDIFKPQSKTHSEQKLFTRPQFLEFLLRIAIQKYSKPKNLNQPHNVLSPLDSFNQLLISLKNYQSTLSTPAHWRQHHLHSYQISLLINSYSHFLQHIYHTYAGINQKNMNTRIQKKLLLNQFKQLFLDSSLRKTRQALKDAQTAFADSKLLQIQEGLKEQGLSERQFWEAMARMAFSSSPKPIGTQQYKIWQKIQQIHNHHQTSHLSQNVNLQIPLFLKLQALLKKIYKENRQLYHSRKMDKLFEKGIFADQVEMLIEILKLRVDWCQEKAKPIGGGQKMIGKKIKLNSIDAEEGKGLSIDAEERRGISMDAEKTRGEELINSIEIEEKKGQQEKKMKSSGDASMREKITLEVLVRQVKEKYKKMAEELDRNFNDYEEVSEPDENA